MLQFINEKRGQSTLEYAVLIIVIIGALLSIQIYLKRGVMGRLKGSSDEIGEQYSAGNTNYLKSVRTASTTVESTAAGQTFSALADDEHTNTIERKQIVNVDQEYRGE